MSRELTFLSFDSSSLRSIHHVNLFAHSRSSRLSVSFFNVLYTHDLFDILLLRMIRKKREASWPPRQSSFGRVSNYTHRLSLSHSSSLVSNKNTKNTSWLHRSRTHTCFNVLTWDHTHIESHRLTAAVAMLNSYSGKIFFLISFCLCCVQQVHLIASENNDTTVTSSTMASAKLSNNSNDNITATTYHPPITTVKSKPIPKWKKQVREACLSIYKLLN